MEQETSNVINENIRAMWAPSPPKGGKTMPWESDNRFAKVAAIAGIVGLAAGLILALMAFMGASAAVESSKDIYGHITASQESDIFFSSLDLSWVTLLIISAAVFCLGEVIRLLDVISKK